MNLSTDKILFHPEPSFNLHPCDILSMCQFNQVRSDSVQSGAFYISRHFDYLVNLMHITFFSIICLIFSISNTFTLGQVMSISGKNKVTVQTKRTTKLLFLFVPDVNSPCLIVSAFCSCSSSLHSTCNFSVGILHFSCS